MALRSGLGGQLGISVEATPGTYVAPTDFLPITKAPFKRKQNVVSPKLIMGGLYNELDAMALPTTRDASGTIEMPVMNKKMGKLIQALMGTTVTPVQQGATAAYLQTHTLADTYGKSLTVQVGAPDASATGVVRPYTVVGGKVTAAEFTYDIDKEIAVKFDVDAMDLAEVQTLVASSFATGMHPFVGVNAGAGGAGAAGGVKVGVYGAEASIPGIRKVSIKIGRVLDVERFYFGAVTKFEQIGIDGPQITGTINADFVDKTVFADRFAANTSFSLVVEAVGALIASTYYETFRITLSGCRLTDGTPTLDDVKILNGDFPFVCRYDGTNAPKIEIISTDVTI